MLDGLRPNKTFVYLIVRGHVEAASLCGAALRRLLALDVRAKNLIDRGTYTRHGRYETLADGTKAALDACQRSKGRALGLRAVTIETAYATL